MATDADHASQSEELNNMENQNGTQTEFAYDGQEVALNDLKAQMEQQRKEAMKGSRFRQIEDGKTAQLSFTGKLFKRTSTGTDEKGNAYKADKIDLELNDKVAEGKDAGKNKLFSVGAKNRVVFEILGNIEKGRTTMLISRTGTGKGTKYSVTTPE